MSSLPMYRPMPRRNAEGQVSLAKWPTTTSSRSPASPWDVDDSTAQTVSRLNSYFGFRPPSTYRKPVATSPDQAAGYSPELPQLCPDRTPELRHDTPSEARARTSSFGPETPPMIFDTSFPNEPHVQPLTPARHGPSHLRSYSDGCSLQSFRTDYRAESEVSNAEQDYKQHLHTALMPRAGDSLHTQSSTQETSSPHHSYTVNLTRDNRAVTLCLTSGASPNPSTPTITCFRQTYLPLGGQYAEFFKASEALALLQHMVNAPSQPTVPLSRRERSELMFRMRTSQGSMVLGDPCSNARAWTSFFSAELAAGRVWEAGTIIFPWAMLQKLMNSLNSECGRKRRMQTRMATPHVRQDMEDDFGSRAHFQHSQTVDSHPVSLQLTNESELSAIETVGDRNSVSSMSPPPHTPTEPNPAARIPFMRDRVRSPVSSASPIRRRRQNSEPIRRLSLSPPRIALLKSNPCRQSLRRLHAASAPSQLVFYDSIRTWPTSSYRSRVRLPPCSKFLELAAADHQGTNPRNPIVL
ncbi:uncharacterized protein CTRU02_206288 [Colletotrichum truncatum]|uniref:Uncharacterized protein n=1 Tax=Colletotrichum truncatum TaxID=5467 RepID=A0ACC3Z6F3_COLTU|nr:uncharacterized protein CTRU02_09873 [Colletotrichum truncatum]KAF6788060.1 hypothetical protein CTRU02_09873 [Colletotrichum truncatum]